MRTLLLTLLGASIGSFLGLVIDRFPNQSLLWPSSHCQSCQTRLQWRDLIPVLSQVINRSRCRYCHVKLPLWYAGLEIACGISLALWDLAWFNGWQTYFIYLSLLLACYDVKEQAYPLFFWLLGSLPMLIHFELTPLSVFFLLLAGLAEWRSIKIGSGDFLYLATMCLMLDAYHVFWAIQIACGLAIGYLLLTDKEQRLAFVPFLMTGYLLTNWLL